jgi:hypothetical protein
MPEPSRVHGEPGFHGAVANGGMLALLRQLHGLRATGRLRIHAGDSRAVLRFRQGEIRAARFNQWSGAPALSRVILMGAAEFRLEDDGAPLTVNLAKDTGFILDEIGRMLAALPPPALRAVADDALPELGAQLGKCRLVAELARDATTVTYRARHRDLDLDVAVTVPRGGLEDAVMRCRQALDEARLLARIDHPNILRVFDCSAAGPYPHVVAELVDGASLANLIARRQRLDAELALTLLGQAVEALAFAHDVHGVIHGALTPRSLLLTRDLQVKLAGFGRVASCAADPAYLAPEQVAGGAADRRSDIYALGAILYHAVTGRPPFADPDPVQCAHKRLAEAPIPPHLVTPQVERRLSQFTMSMLARDPANRIQSHDELVELLGDLLEYQLATSARRRTPSEAGEGNVIRRRTSFWNYVPRRLFRRGSEGGAVQAG